MPSPAGAPSLEELRRSYRAALQANGGHLKDPALGQALVDALERELLRLSSRMNRTGTVYHMPAVPKAPAHPK